jgi:hypothetical protein
MENIGKGEGSVGKGDVGVGNVREGNVGKFGMKENVGIVSRMEVGNMGNGTRPI